MKYFFTADEHYGHIKILEYCNRPFTDIQEMDGELIRRHNELVGLEDTVIHVGDFTLKKTLQEANNYIRKLNGTHIFVRGSHDYWNPTLPHIIEFTIDGIYVVVCHYAMKTWARSHYGSIQLYGHSHGKLEPQANQMDIGVDTNNFYPYSFEDIKKKLKI